LEIKHEETPFSWIFGVFDLIKWSLWDFPRDN